MESILDWITFLWRGVIGTLGLAGVTAVLTILYGSLLALARISPFRPFRILSRVDVDFFRSIPLLALLIFFFFGVGAFAGQFGVTAFWLAVIALTLTESAYLAEVYRGALESIPPSQWEAARSLGMGWRRTVRLIVLPQAILPAIPATVNVLIAILKDSALASLIGVGELTLQAQILTSITFKPMDVYLLVALMYLAIIMPLSLLSSYSERVVESRVGLRIGNIGGAAELSLPTATNTADVMEDRP